VLGEPLREHFHREGVFAQRFMDVIFPQSTGQLFGSGSGRRGLTIEIEPSQDLWVGPHRSSYGRWRSGGSSLHRIGFGPTVHALCAGASFLEPLDVPRQHLGLDEAESAVFPFAQPHRFGKPPRVGHAREMPRAQAGERLNLPR
jgi:hypothetical protein